MSPSLFSADTCAVEVAVSTTLDCLCPGARLPPTDVRLCHVAAVVVFPSGREGAIPRDTPRWSECENDGKHSRHRLMCLSSRVRHGQVAVGNASRPLVQDVRVLNILPEE